jgi:hypothetical protein
MDEKNKKNKALEYVGLNEPFVSKENLSAEVPHKKG